METKICRKCNIEKNIDKYKERTIKNKIYISNICVECERKANNEYMKNIYYKNNKDKIIKYQNKYRESHKKELNDYFKEYYQKNKEKRLSESKKYRQENKDKINKYKLNKTRNDKIYAFKCTIRKMLSRSFTRKKFTKNKHLEEIIGLNINQLLNYLLQTFKNNYGYEWNGIEPVHIDHIIPLKYATTEEEIIKLCHYTNLQLLKVEDNLKKGAKLE